MEKISWGILSTANIGIQRMIPALQRGKYTRVEAIASRDDKRAGEVARKMGIQKHYGTYEELLEDKEIQAVYIPLPNHLHITWTLKCLAAGKHVLCEKPLSFNLEEAERLLEEVKRYPRLKVMEAFMYRFHPQWAKCRSLMDEQGFGKLRHINSIFTYYKMDETNIRNRMETGGGGLLDIGCYCISLSRFLYKSEPRRVCGSVEYDPVMKIDRLASGLMEFAGGTASFTCATQVYPHQQAELFGEKGMIRLPKPFTPPPGEEISFERTMEKVREEHKIPPCDHYSIQGDSFSRSILDDSPVLTPLEDGIANLKVIDKLLKSAKKGVWIDL